MCCLTSCLVLHFASWCHVGKSTVYVRSCGKDYLSCGQEYSICGVMWARLLVMWPRLQYMWGHVGNTTHHVGKTTIYMGSCGQDYLSCGQHYSRCTILHISDKLIPSKTLFLICFTYIFCDKTCVWHRRIIFLSSMCLIYTNGLFYVIGETIPDVIYWPLFNKVLIFYILDTPSPQNNVVVK